MRGDRPLQTDSAVPAVSPLNLNLPAPHGMRQPSMRLRFASEARDAAFPPKGALLRQSFRVSVWRVTYGASGCTGCIIQLLAVCTIVLLTSIVSQAFGHLVFCSPQKEKKMMAIMKKTTPDGIWLSYQALCAGFSRLHHGTAS